MSRFLFRGEGEAALPLMHFRNSCLVAFHVQARALAANGYLADVDEDDEAVIGQVIGCMLSAPVGVIWLWGEAR